MMGYSLMLVGNLAPGDLPPNVADYWERLSSRPGYLAAVAA